LANVEGELRMDWNTLGIAVLLTLSGLYFLESERAKAPLQDLPARMLQPARTALERAWQTEPVQVFLRQLLAARHRRSNHWPMDKSRL
jgi:hypothetical protein